jgi:hypothetical protein
MGEIQNANEAWRMRWHVVKKGKKVAYRASAELGMTKEVKANGVLL